MVPAHVIRLELLARLRRMSRNGRGRSTADTRHERMHPQALASSPSPAPGRALAAVLAVGSLIVLLDAGAKYPDGISHAAAFAGEPAAAIRDDSTRKYAPYRFRLGATLPLDGARGRCPAEDPRAASVSSPSGDESFDINCSASATVKAVGDTPRAALQSWRGESRYDRAVRF